MSKTIHVRMNSTKCNSEMSLMSGNKYELDETVARALIKDGHATALSEIPVEEKKKEVNKVEKAVKK